MSCAHTLCTCKKKANGWRCCCKCLVLTRCAHAKKKQMAGGVAVSVLCSHAVHMQKKSNWHKKKKEKKIQVHIAKNISNCYLGLFFLLFHKRCFSHTTFIKRFHHSTVSPPYHSLGAGAFVIPEQMFVSASNRTGSN